MNMYCKRCEFLKDCDARTEKEMRECVVETIAEFKGLIKELEYRSSDLFCVFKNLRDYERIRSLLFLLGDAANLAKFDLGDASK